MSKDNITEPVNTWDNFYQPVYRRNNYQYTTNILRPESTPYLKGGRMWNRYCKPCYFANRREVV